MKTVYLYNPSTGESAGTYDAQASPLEEGVYITPVHSTDAPPPAASIGQAAVYKNGAWTLKPDHRGETWYDSATGEPVVIDALGTPENLSASPPPAMMLAEAKTAKLLSIEASYASTVTADIEYMGTTFQANEQSQTLMASVLVALGGASPGGFMWWDKANTGIAMTNSQLQGLAQTILMRGQPLFAHKQDLKAQVRAASDIQTVEAIEW